jgi:hypothetical protein
MAETQMNIVYCFIGHLPHYSVDTVYQTRLFYDGPIYFIISDYESPYVKKLLEYKVSIVRYDDVRHARFEECIKENYDNDMNDCKPFESRHFACVAQSFHCRYFEQSYNRQTLAIFVLKDRAASFLGTLSLFWLYYRMLFGTIIF